VQHLRRLHTFANLYALRDQPTERGTAESSVAVEEALRSAMYGATSGLLRELNEVMSAGEAHSSEWQWDGMLASLDQKSYRIALWKLLTENVDLLSCEFHL